MAGQEEIQKAMKVLVAANEALEAFDKETSILAKKKSDDRNLLVATNQAALKHLQLLTGI